MAHAEADAQASAAEFGDGAARRSGQEGMAEIDVGDIGADRQARGGAGNRLRAGKRIATAFIDEHRIKTVVLGKPPDVDEFLRWAGGDGGKHDAEARARGCCRHGGGLCGNGK